MYYLDAITLFKYRIAPLDALENGPVNLDRDAVGFQIQQTDQVNDRRSIGHIPVLPVNYYSQFNSEGGSPIAEGKLSTSTDEVLQLAPTAARLRLDDDCGGAGGERRKRYIKG